ncbi:hypothetical protein Q5P01_000552 [Channa striata]|uniref:ORF28 N-terminal domain-containing protein n=1 Tax=Channa striata TaxID=64152 RepID=A0AA88LN37_CHASR|nr:hypothetical protein Q5P01_000552 [Channa striata]
MIAPTVLNLHVGVNTDDLLQFDEQEPGRAVFLPQAGKDIGRVECYWHVHSKSIDKTFLFCCVSCDITEYAKRLLGSLTQDGAASTAFSMGTVGDNAYGSVTEECSLVSVPVRPGCFWVAVADGDAVTRTKRHGDNLALGALDFTYVPL